MKWLKSAVILGLIISMLWPLHSCKTVPVTDRKQFAMYSNKRLKKKYIQDYHWDVIHGSLAVGTEGDIMVKTVGARMRPVYERILKDAGREKELNHHEWEFNVLISELPTAYAIPGGKVMFHSALIPVCKDEDGVAFVMAHELAHVLANHYCEGETHQEMGELAMFAVITVATGGRLDYYDTDLLATASIIAVRASFNYKKEMEADRLGLILMARAGYDPTTSIEYMNRYNAFMKYEYDIDMNKKDSLRRDELIRNLPEAQEYYQEFTESLKF